jgi:hypothetical protein
MTAGRDHRDPRNSIHDTQGVRSDWWLARCDDHYLPHVRRSGRSPSVKPKVKTCQLLRLVEATLSISPLARALPFLGGEMSFNWGDISSPVAHPIICGTSLAIVTPSFA